MDNSVVQQLASNRRIRLILILFIAIIIILVFVSILMRSDDFRITKLAINNDNRSIGFDGNSIYAYNGSSFYKLPLADSSEPKILGGGVKLPGITKALWVGDEGVILNFDQSLIYTAVEEEAKEKNLSYDQRGVSTWYFDFSSNTLSYLNDSLLYNSVYYFNDTMAYYLTRGEDSFILHSLNSKTRSISSVPIPLGFQEITSISKCPDSNETCIVGVLAENPQTTGIYSMRPDREIRELFRVDGKIYPIYQTSKYLVLDNADDSSIAEEGSIPQFQKGILLDIKTKDRQTVDRVFRPDSFLYASYDQGNLVIVGDSSESYTTIKSILGFKSITDGSLRYADGKGFVNGIVIQAKPSQRAILFESTDGHLNVFAENGSIRNNISTLSSTQAQRMVEKCADSNMRVQYQSETSTFTILIPDDKNFKKEQNSTSSCVNKETDLAYGYNFSFVSFDQKSGRVTSY